MSPGEQGKSLSLSIANRLGELQRVEKATRHFTQQHRLPPMLGLQLELILEEVITNVIAYGYPKGSDQHEIRIELRMAEHGVVLRIEDDGREFNPLKVPLPNTNRNLKERPVGGLGIFLVRQLADRIDYRREEGKNILTIEKFLRGERGREGGGA